MSCSLQMSAVLVSYVCDICEVELPSLLIRGRFNDISRVTQAPLGHTYETQIYGK